MSNFRPLKAPSKGIPDDFLLKLIFPLMVSPKYDGLRVLNRDGAKTSSLKPVRNLYTNSSVSHITLQGFDGEMLVGDGADPKGFSKATSAVMAREGIYDIIWQVFDICDMNRDIPYTERYAELKLRITRLSKEHAFVRLVHHEIMNSLEELLEYEKYILAAGYEGAMLRSLDGIYKYDRSTMNQQILLKLKRGHEKRADAIVIGFNERMHNNNPAYINERGLTQRSSNKENMMPMGMLGSFQVRDVDTGKEFSIGMGVEGTMDDAFRIEVWNNQEEYLAKVIRYQWFDYGGYDLPRFPKFISFRHPEDMS
ncbi:MAG: hypothetical protein QQN63_13060 [Nitrosopumilus sp.]